MAILESKSTKKIKKELYPHQNLVTKMKNKGDTASNGNEIVQVATEFYQILFGETEMTQYNNITQKDATNTDSI